MHDPRKLSYVLLLGGGAHVGAVPADLLVEFLAIVLHPRRRQRLHLAPQIPQRSMALLSSTLFRMRLVQGGVLLGFIALEARDHHRIVHVLLIPLVELLDVLLDELLAEGKVHRFEDPGLVLVQFEHVPAALGALHGQHVLNVHVQ